jgi:hypothetical protein
MRRRLSALEEIHGLGAKTHVIWDRGNAKNKKAIAALIAAGADKDDKFIAVSWETGPERPMGAAKWDPPPSRWPFPSRDAPPPANNDDQPEG